MAITSQVVSVRGLSINNVPRELSKNIRVLEVFSMDRAFTTRDIWGGNEFTVRVRGINEAGRDNITCIINQVMERGGLPTYYGYQRFGLKRPNSHIIGKYIILGKFEEAINELLTHAYPTEPPRIREAREFIARTGNYAKALELIPRGGYRYYPERAVLRHLSSNPRDFGNAIRKLPHELLTIYIEAYQSYIFNLALSERIGRNLPINMAVQGDMVVLLDERGLPTRHMIHVNEAMTNKVNELVKRSRAIPVAHLVGYSTKLLPGPQGDIELEVLRREGGVDPSMFRVKSIPRLLIRGGGYRPLFIRPSIFNISISGNDLTLVFRLPRGGNYATVFLRELMKSGQPEVDFT